MFYGSARTPQRDLARHHETVFAILTADPPMIM